MSRSGRLPCRKNVAAPTAGALQCRGGLPRCGLRRAGAGFGGQA